MWFKINSADFLNVTESMTATERGIYISLLMLSMGNGGPRALSLTRAQMLKAAGASQANMTQLINILETRFRMTPQGYRPVLEKQFYADTDAPAADNRVGPDLTIERTLAEFPQKIEPAILFEEVVTEKTLSARRQTTQAKAGIPAKIERAKNLLIDGMEMRPKYHAEDYTKTPDDRRREYSRRRREHTLELRKFLADAGVPTSEHLGLRALQKMVVDKLGELESIPEPAPTEELVSLKTRLENAEVIDGIYLELSDNYRELNKAATAWKGTLPTRTESVGVNHEAEGNLTGKLVPGEGRGVWGAGCGVFEELNALEIFSNIKGASNARITKNNGTLNENIAVVDSGPPGSTAAGLAARALRLRGIPDAHPSHAGLLDLLAQGVTIGELTMAAEEATRRNSPRFAYVLALVKGRREDAAKAAVPPPPAVMPSGETVDDLDRRIFGED